MAKKGSQTEKSRYPSKYAPNTYITTEQFILELICERQANFQKKVLSVYFWKNQDWANIYKRWLRAVHRLSKKYSAEAILHALQDNRAKYKWSLDTDFMKDLIREHYELILKYEKEKEEKLKEYEQIVIPEGDTFRENTINKDLEKLLNLD